MVTLNINDKDYQVEAELDELLVWVIHEKVGLTKTRFGCGMQMCGSCKVLINGEMTYTCNLKVAEVLGQKITTREGLSDDHPLVTGVTPKQVN